MIDGAAEMETRAVFKCEPAERALLYVSMR